MPILTATSLIFPFAITPFDICKEYPDTWILIKKLYWISFFLSYIIIYNFIYNSIEKYHKNRKKLLKEQKENISQNSDLKLLARKRFV